MTKLLSNGKSIFVPSLASADRWLCIGKVAVGIVLCYGRLAERTRAPSRVGGGFCRGPPVFQHASAPGAHRQRGPLFKGSVLLLRHRKKKPAPSSPRIIKRLAKRREAGETEQVRKFVISTRLLARRTSPT